MKTRTALTALAAALWASPAAAETRPMTPQDLVELKRLGAPSVWEEGQLALFSLSSAKDDYSGRTTAYYTLDLSQEGAAPVPLTQFDEFKPSGMIFGAEGHVWFVSSRTGSAEIYHSALDGTPVQASNFAGADFSGFKLSADGTGLVVYAERHVDCADLACANVEAESTIGDAYAYDETFVRQWDTWLAQGVKSRLFGYQVEGGKLVGNGAPLDAGLGGNTPSRPFGGDEEIALSPNGDWVVFAQREGGNAEPTSTDLDLYMSPIDGRSAPVLLTGDNEATDNLPVFSPDGSHLAYAAMARPGYESDKMAVYLHEFASGTTRPLTDHWDRSVGSIAWTPAGDALVVGVGEIQEHPLYRVNVATRSITEIVRTGNASNAVPLSDGSTIFTMNSILAPTDLYRAADGEVTQLTAVNAEAMAEFDPVTYEKFSFAGADGETVWGFSLKPVTDEELPIAFVVHGGPQGSFGNSWSTRWNPRALSAGRYAVVSVDFHGSSGYGQDFTDSINQDWGGKPLEDLQLGLDYALAQDAQLDGDRICALGASYGGYMMNWIAGNWPDRFDCLINHNGLFDMRGFYYSTEELWFPRWDMGGSYAEAADVYEKWNPVNHIDKWQTPMLVVLGLKDYRVPYAQGLGAFTALQERDIPSRLLVFPDENHWVLNGANSIRWHNEVHDWMDRWTAEDAE